MALLCTMYATIKLNVDATSTGAANDASISIVDYLSEELNGVSIRRYTDYRHIRVTAEVSVQFGPKELADQVFTFLGGLPIQLRSVDLLIEPENFRFRQDGARP